MINIINRPRQYTAKSPKFCMIGRKREGEWRKTAVWQLRGEQSGRTQYCFLSQRFSLCLFWALQTWVQSWQPYQVLPAFSMEITLGILDLISCSQFGGFKETVMTVLKGFRLSAALGKVSTKTNWQHYCHENRGGNKAMTWILQTVWLCF